MTSPGRHIRRVEVEVHSFLTLVLLFPWEGILVLNEQKAGWAQSWSGRRGVEKNLFLPLGFEPWIGQLSHYTSYVF